MEKYYPPLSTDISYNDDIFETDLDALAIERSKTGSLYWELIAVLKNLSGGVDLTRIQAPMYLIKPVSFIEVFSQYVQPTEKVLKVGTEKDAATRMLYITEYMISSFFETIKEVHHMGKPYNSILGEIFTCQWKHEDSTSYFFGEQVSHHPPITASYMINKEHNFKVSATVETKMQLLGNTAENLIIGQFNIELLDLKEIYVIQFPKIVVRGIFWGSVGVENGGELNITCKNTNLTTNASFDYYHNVIGAIKDDSGTIYKISGSMKDKVIVSNEGKSNVLEITRKKVLKKMVTKLEEQKFNESRKLWYPVTEAILKGDTDAALKFKSDLEEQQRHYRKSEKFEPKMFKKTDEFAQNVPIYQYLD